MLLFLFVVTTHSFVCHYSCLTCSGPNSDQCLLCSQGVATSGACQCNLGLYQNGICKATCDQGYYQLLDECIACVEHCKTCQNSICSDCLENFVLVNQEFCQPSCNQGYYFLANSCVQLIKSSDVSKVIYQAFNSDINQCEIEAAEFTFDSITLGTKCKYFHSYTFFGDNYVWHSKVGKIYFYDLTQHQFIRVYLKAFFADQWNYGDYLQLFIDDEQIYEFKITNNVWGQYLMTDILTNSTHTKSDLTLKIKVFNQGQTGYFGINNLQLISDICGCAKCDSGQCKQQTSWGGSCLQNQLFVDLICVDCILLQNRMANCDCIQGYFLNSETNQCETCSAQCLTCKYIANYCLTCNVNRKNPSICICNDGYYENLLQQCTVCPSQCLTCSDATNCLKCTNPQFDAPKCECKYQIVQNPLNCLKCTQQNLLIKFSAIYNQIILTLENNFSLLSNKCQYIFLKVSLDSFGEFSQCKITDNEIKVFMDDTFSYTKQNSSLELNSSNFIMENCLYPLQNIFPYYLENTDDGEIFMLNQNQVYLKKDSENLIAYQTNIKKIFDLKWQILQLQQNDEFIETLVNSWNQLTDKQNFILSGSQFRKNNIVNFTLQYCDFSGKCGQAQLDVIIELDSVNQNLLSITSQNPPFYENQKLIIKLEFNGQSTNSNQSILINYQFIGQNVNMQQINYTLYLNDFLIITVKENSLVRGQIYQLTVKGAQDQIDFPNIQYFYLISQAPDMVRIKGGSKQVSYSKPLLLTLTKNNVDQTEINNQFNSITWECKSLATNSECLNQLNELVLKVNNVTILNLEKFSFLPYTVIEIIVYAMQENTLYSDKASLFFIEDEIPLLDVEILNNSNVQKNNDYDKIQFKLKLQSTQILIDECIYSNSIISNFQIIAYYIFHYPELKVMLSNFYDLSKNENLIYKFSVLTPYFQMPSVSSLLLKFNASPKQCKINLINIDNQFYKINVTSCNKEDMPHQYRFGVQFVNNNTIFEEQIRNIYLNEFSYKNYLITQLINFLNETQNITVFADVLDTFLGKSHFQLVVLIQPQKFSQTYVDQISKWFVGDSYIFQIDYLFQYLYINNLDSFISEIKNTVSFSDETVTNMKFNLILEQVNQNIQDSMIDQISSYLEMRTNQIQDDIQNLKMQNQYQYLNQLQIEFNIESCLKDISLFLNLLNKYESKNRRILSESELVLQYINKLGYMQLLMQLPNEEKKQFKYENFCLILQQITNKLLNTSEIYLKMINNSYISIKQIKLRYNEMTSNLRIPNFQETSYPIQAFNISTQEGKEVNNIDEGYVRYNFELKPENEDNSHNFCAIQSREGWDEEQCQTIKEQNQIVCQCSKVSYTTISQIIINFQRNLFYLFSDTNFKKIKQQNYVEVLFLYVNIMITIIYIWFLFYGKKLDSNVPGQQECQTKVFPQEKTGEIFQKKMMNNQNETYNKASNLEQIDHLKYENVNQPRSSQRIFELGMSEKLESEIQTPNVRANLEIQEIKSILRITDNKSSSLVNKIENEGSISKINIIEGKTSPTTFQIFLNFYKNYHKIIALYFKNDEKQSRALRGTLIYISLLGQMSLINWFGEVYDTEIVIFLSIMSYLFGLVYKKLLSFFLSNTLFVFQYLGYLMATSSALFFMFVTVSSIPLYHDILFCNLWALSFIIGVLIDLTLYTTLQIILMFWVLMKFKQFSYFQKIFKRLLDPVCYAIIFETQ